MGGGGRQKTPAVFQESESSRRAMLQKRKLGLFQKVADLERVSGARTLCILQSTEPKGKRYFYRHQTGAEDNIIPRRKKREGSNKSRKLEKYIADRQKRLLSFKTRAKSVYQKALELELLCGAYMMVTVDLIDRDADPEKTTKEYHYRYASGDSDYCLPKKCIPKGWQPECGGRALVRLNLQDKGSDANSEGETSGDITNSISNLDQTHTLLPEVAESMDLRPSMCESLNGSSESYPVQQQEVEHVPLSHEPYRLPSIPSVPSVTSLLVENPDSESMNVMVEGPANMNFEGPVNATVPPEPYYDFDQFDWPSSPKMLFEPVCEPILHPYELEQTQYVYVQPFDQAGSALDGTNPFPLAYAPTTGIQSMPGALEGVPVEEELSAECWEGLVRFLDNRATTVC